MKRMVACCLLLCALSFTQLTAAYGAEQFRDIEDGNPYGANILYAREQGFVSGVGNNLFYSDNNRATLQNTSVVLCRAFAPDFVGDSVSYALEHDWVPEQVSSPETRLTIGQMSWMVLRAVGIPVSNETEATDFFRVIGVYGVSLSHGDALKDQMVAAVGCIHRLSQPFEDLSPNHPFYEDLMLAKQSRYITGVREGVLAPDVPMSEGAARLVLLRMYPDVVLDGLLQDGSVDTISPEQFFSALLRAAGVSDAIIEAHGGPVSAAKALGLWADSMDPALPMTRGDAMGAAARLKFSGYEGLLTGFVGEISIVNPLNENLEPYYKELCKVPVSILDLFIEKGWEIRLADPYLNSFESDKISGFKASGLTSYSDKRIYLNGEGSLVHEFGHFFDWVLDFDAKHLTLYQAEKTSACELIRDYAGTDEREFFADVFRVWVNSAPADDFRTELSQVMPKSHAYFCELEEAYSFPVSIFD